ncbi:hypothetical protein [Empedobacter tilapiae]|uniref:hypothetical protein n=1 Tax=Empedobacter tilapiae TaxID=2491114 RepID=UPI0028D125A5|nr:hypothetical protein [Empedobacter tilapiae]
MVPEIINSSIDIQQHFQYIDTREKDYIEEAKSLFNSGFYSYSMLAIWNAAINNLKRRVEAYSVELWSTVVKDEAGRKKYDKTGETITERWSNVDDLILIKGATSLGLLNPKAGKSLEMINWMRNHASPAHDSDNRVEREDVISLILLLQKNLFEKSFPEPGHTISTIFEPLKTTNLNTEELEILKDQIKSFRTLDIRTTYGFFMEIINSGNEPSLSNIINLFPTLWEFCDEDLRKVIGVKYHNLVLDPNSDDSPDKGAKTRIFEQIIRLNAVNYIPDGTRARIFRRAADKLRTTKNTSYGWHLEESAALNINQLGTSVPSVAFEEVYQEIIAVWCGNFWGRSSSHTNLQPFFNDLNTDKVRIITNMFLNNERVLEELSQRKPKDEALELLRSLEAKLTIEAHKQELQNAINYISRL